MENLDKIVGYFEPGKTPTYEEFKKSWTSFFHKSEKFPQTQILGLNDSLKALDENKIDRDELVNLGVGIKGYGDDVQNITDLQNVPDKYEGLAVVVINDMNENGNSFAWLYDGAKWNKTPYTTLPKDVITSVKLTKRLTNDAKKAPSNLAVTYDFNRLDDILGVQRLVFNAYDLKYFNRIKSDGSQVVATSVKCTDKIDLRGAGKIRVTLIVSVADAGLAWYDSGGLFLGFVIRSGASGYSLEELEVPERAAFVATTYWKDEYLGESLPFYLELLDIGNVNLIPDSSRMDSDTIVFENSAGHFEIRYPDANNYVQKTAENDAVFVSLDNTGGENPAFWMRNVIAPLNRDKSLILSFSIKGNAAGVISINTDSQSSSIIEYNTEWVQKTIGVKFGEHYGDMRLMFYTALQASFFLKDLALYDNSNESDVKLIKTVNELSQQVSKIGVYNSNLIPDNSLLDEKTTIVNDGDGKGISAGIFDIRYPANAKNYIQKTAENDAVYISLDASAGQNPAFWAVNKLPTEIQNRPLTVSFWVKGDVSGSVILTTNGGFTGSIHFTQEWRFVSFDASFGTTYADNRFMLYVTSGAVKFYLKGISLLTNDTLADKIRLLETEIEKITTNDIDFLPRNYLSKTARIKYGDNVQCIIGLLGDSWTQHTWLHTKYVTPIAKHLREKYGDAGGGFYSFSMSHSGTAKMGSVDPDDAIDTRSGLDLITYRDQITDCRWVDAADATFKQGAFLNLQILKPHDRLIIHFYADASAGKFTYKVDNGAPIEIDASTCPTGHNTIEINAFDVAHTLRFDITAGEVMLFGVDMQRTSAGVRIHKLGNKGASTGSFVIVDKPTWQQGLASLGLDTITILLGTNDGTEATVTVYNNLKTLINNIREVDEFMDISLIMPSNAIGRDMSNQAKYQYNLALEENVGFVNLIPLFGSTEQIVAKGTFYDTLHPTMQSGLMIAKHLIEKIFT